MSMVAGLHAAALYLIASSLGIVPPLIQKTPPITLEPQPPAPPEAPPEPVPQPTMEQPPLTMPPPVVQTDAFEQPDPLIIERTDQPPVIPEVVPPAHPVQLTGVRPDARYPLTQPAYPMADVRDGKEGSVELEVYVLPTGRIGDVRVIKSTGSATLDQSAMDEARRRWRLLPATRDGEPYAQWHRLRVVFNLKSR